LGGTILFFAYVKPILACGPIWNQRRCDKGARKTYALLREALAKSGKVGVAQFVLRNRKSLCVLKAQGNALP
jgi:hypothetical protein